MKLQEYQAKHIFGQFGVPVPKGEVATTPAEARQIAERLGGTVVVKSQVLVGGRGKAGGIKLAKTPAEAEEVASRILGMDIKGLTVKKVLVDPAADIEKEIYLGMVIDRARRRVVMMASSEGGVDIEEVAATTPGEDHPGRGRSLPGPEGLPGARPGDGHRAAARAVRRLRARSPRRSTTRFVGSDASLAEINPLVVQGDGSLLALDGKMVLDDNALFRHPDLAAMRDEDEETAEERKARADGLSYVKLDGEIGCMVNGAGLAMATMDIIKLLRRRRRPTSSTSAAAPRPTRSPRRCASSSPTRTSRRSSSTSSAASPAATRWRAASCRRWTRCGRRCRWSCAWSAPTTTKGGPILREAQDGDR